MKARKLETVAGDSSTTLDAFLCGELIDFAGTLSRRVTAKIPGYRRAYLFPEQE